VAQSLTLPRPDFSGRALEHPGRRPDESGRSRHECLRHMAHAVNVKLFLRGFLVRGKKRMRHLSFDEKKVLQSYLKHRALTRRWNLGSGVVNGLVADGILFRASQVGSQIEGFAYNVHRWAYEYLLQHPDLVATPGDSSEPDAFS
jgi:Super-infection exclusion protein B